MKFSILVKIVLMMIMVGVAVKMIYQMTLYVWRNGKMTNEEKFSKGIVIYKTEDDVVCELWGASTKHADVIYSMNRDIEIDLFRRCQFADDPDYDIFQWLLYVASRQTWKTTARKIVKIALNEWY